MQYFAFIVNFYFPHLRLLPGQLLDFVNFCSTAPKRRRIITKLCGVRKCRRSIFCASRAARAAALR